MATEKITQKQQSENVKDDASFLVTQKENVQGVEMEAVRRATVAAVVAALRNNGIHEGMQTEQGIEDMYPNLVKSIDPIETGIRISFWDDTTMDIPIESGGLAFDEVSYNQETGYLHITLEGEDVVAPCYIGGGGGGGSTSGTVVKITNTTGAASMTVAHGESVDISFTYYDYDGDGEFTNSSGTLELSVNGTVVIQKNIEQGAHTYDVGPYLAAGSNKIKVKVTDEDDMYGMKTWTVNAVALSISSVFDDTAINTGDVTFRYTPIGANIEKTVHFEVDGEEIATAIVTASNRQQTQTIPAQSHGAHPLKVYITAEVDGVDVTSNVLDYDVIWAEQGNETPIIACSFNDKVKQYSTVLIPYIVYNPISLTAAVSLYVDGEWQSNLTVDRTVQYWSYKPTTPGTKTLMIKCGDVEKPIAVTVEDIGIEVQPVTNGLVLDLNPAGHTNNDDDKEQFGYTDANGVNHPLIFSDNFDWVNGGFQTDADGGTYLCVKCGTTVTLDRSLFDTDVIANGKEIKAVFRATKCRDYDAQVMYCMSGGIGLVLQAQKATLKSLQTTLEVPYCEDSMIEMDVNIEPESKDNVMMVWLEGVPSRVAIYPDENEDFTQDNPAPLVIGSNDCDVHIYRLKVYENDLTQYEIHENWIADAPNGEEMVNRYNRNNIYDQNGDIDVQKLITQNPNLRVLEITAPKMTTGKEDEVTCTVKHTYGAGGKAHKFVGEGVIMKAQGTSSMQYGTAAYNLDLEFPNGFEFDDGTTQGYYSMTANSIGVNYFNIKLNVASSENANNVIMAAEYNDFQPYLNPARIANPKVRDTVEGQPCVVFFTNSSDATIQVGALTVEPGQTIMYGCGDMNNSKKNFAVFGQQDNPVQACVEISNNTNNPCLWKSDDLSAETWDGKGSFEFRYPKRPTADHKAAFQRVLSWVVSTDRTAATGNTLAQSVTYDGKTYTTDTAEYRAAKFVAEFEDYFIKDSALYHYLFTERHSMVDNRAKNVFVSTDDGIHWDFTKDYDNDTADGNDNEGGLTLTYGLEDTDTIGTKDVFNASSSVIWCNIRDLMFDDLQALYQTLETRGAWNAERILARYNAYQGARPEALIIEDMWKKYIKPFTVLKNDGYLKMLYGTKKDQRQQFETYQEKYISSKYQGSAATSDTITFRAYTPTNWGGVVPSKEMTITPYADMYVTVKSGSGIARERAKRGQAVKLTCPIDTLNDTEIYIYNASNIADVGDIAPLYVGYFNIAMAVKLRHLKLGDGAEGYNNTNAETIGVGNNELLETLDIQNCPMIRASLDLTGCDALVSLEAECNNYEPTNADDVPGITGVAFAPGGKIETAHLPNVTAFSARSLKNMEDLTFASLGRLRSLRIENCNTIDALDIILNTMPENAEDTKGLTRARILGISWILNSSNSGVLDYLVELKGLNENGSNSDQSVVTGYAYLPTMKASQLDAYRKAWGFDLDLEWQNYIEQYLVTFVNHDGTELYKQYVDRGTAAKDPVEEGWIDEPTRESTVSTVYTYAGWDSSLANITSAKTIKATYSESLRQYTVRWISQLGVILETQTVGYGESATYGGDIPTRTDEESSKIYHLFKGWKQSTGYITGDLDVWAEWEDGYEPSEIVDTQTLNAAQLYGMCRAGVAQNFLSLKDRVLITLGFDPDYDNVDYVDLVEEPTVFDGQTCIETELQPFKDGIADGWTLVVDCKFDATTADQTMVCCMQESGYMGFKVKYSGGPAVQWSTNSYNSSATTYREIMVIRHIPGSRNVIVYSSKAYDAAVGYKELTKTIDTVSNAKVYLGATVTDGGAVGNYATGTLYSCRFWKGDLGDADCRKIVSWPRETYAFEVGGFNKYALSANSVEKTSVDFICASLLERTKTMNSSASNAGGFANMLMFSWLQSRLYQAFPTVWRNFMKQSVIKYNCYVNGTDSNIQECDAHVWLPSYIEMQGGTEEPWIYEGDWVTFFTNNTTRLKFQGHCLARDVDGGYQTFSQKTDPATDTTVTVNDGDLWINTNESSRGYLRVNGKWLASNNYWLRGASVTNSTSFCFVGGNGYVSYAGYSANNSIGVCPRFSI